jgi:hypothetical protein
MDNQKQQAAERIKQANNILVTVSNNPSVDQLAACIGLTLSLNKSGKHATAVFSGQVPSTLEFLQPEKTLERNTDSLRDFIIALDKSKADKLRYKVEDKMVRIFITPYRTSINEKDLEFSQGDFNVDVVVALGVHNQADLDQAITTHGRILHDATILTMNVKPGGELGTINWLAPNASSLSELAVQLIDVLDKRLVDGQIATAFLTGIVAETDRFSNSKTSPTTMSISAELMAAGANQQLVATKLEEPAPLPPEAPLAHQEAGGEAADIAAENKPDDGTLEIAHGEKGENTEEPSKEEKPESQGEPPKEENKVEPAPEPPKPPVEEETTLPEPVVELPPLPPTPQVKIDEHGVLAPVDAEKEEEAAAEALLPPVKHEPPTISHHNESLKMALEPPELGGELTANTATNAFGLPSQPGGMSGIPGMPAQEGSLPPSMQEDLPSASPAFIPSALGGAQDGEPQNAPGTSFLGEQPLAAPSSPAAGTAEAEDQPATPAGGNQAGDQAGGQTFKPTVDETLSDIERDVHSSHLASSDVPFSPVGGGTPLAPPPDIPVVLPNPPPQGADLVPDMPVMPPPSGPSDLTAPPPPLPTSDENPDASVDSARSAVEQAINGSADQTPQAVQALNAQQVDLTAGANDNGVPAGPVQPWVPPDEDGNLPQPDDGAAAQTSYQNPEAPPPVPPPMVPLPPNQ